MKVLSILFLASLFVIISSISFKKKLRKKNKQDFLWGADFNSSLNNIGSVSVQDHTSTSSYNAAVKEATDAINKIDFNSFGATQSTSGTHSTTSEVPTGQSTSTSTAVHDAAKSVDGLFQEW